MAKTGRDLRAAAAAAPQSLDTVEFADPRQSLRADVAAEILGSKDVDGHYRKMAVFEPAPDGDPDANQTLITWPIAD